VEKDQQGNQHASITTGKLEYFNDESGFTQVIINVSRKENKGDLEGRGVGAVKDQQLRTLLLAWRSRTLVSCWCLASMTGDWPEVLRWLA